MNANFAFLRAILRAKAHHGATESRRKQKTDGSVSDRRGFAWSRTRVSIFRFRLSSRKPSPRKYNGSLISAYRFFFSRKKSEHFPFPGCHSLQEGKMAGHAIAGEAILKNSAGTKAKPRETVENLVAGHSGMVFRIAYSILRNHHDAEDAVQECFLRAVKYGRDLEHVRNIKTWLGRIAWTVALDRRAQREAAGQRDSTA